MTKNFFQNLSNFFDSDDCARDVGCVIDKNIDAFLEGDLNDNTLNQIKEKFVKCPNCKYSATLELGYGFLKE